MIEFSKIPDPREDGLCADCMDREAVTTDGRFCKACLKRRVKHENPIEGEFKRKRCLEEDNHGWILLAWPYHTHKGDDEIRHKI
jgi:hypothetical protein